MKKNKILGLLVLTVFLSVYLSVSALGAVSLSMSGNRTFSTNAIIQGIIITNITVTTSPTANGITNCSLWGKSNALTANTTYYQIPDTAGKLWQSNLTSEANATNFSITWNTAKFEDGNDYKFKAICSNSTDGSTTMNLSSSEITSLTIDNTEPATPTALVPSTDTILTNGTATGSTANFSCSVTDARTTSCTITIGADTYTAGYTGTSCSYVKSALPTQTYDWYCTASDESNTTRTSVNRITIRLPSSSDEILALGQKTDETGKPLLSTNIGGSPDVMPGWFIALLIAIVIGVFLFLSRKK